MRQSSRIIVSSAVASILSACGDPNGNLGGLVGEDQVATTESALEATTNPYGQAETFHTTGAIDRTNPFFLALGTNLRTCETCHASNQGWAVTTAATKELFQSTEGLAPLFMLHDAGSRPDAPITTFAERKVAFKPTLVQRGLIRFGRTVPATADFTVTAVFDPAGFATPTQITNFRRPTPTSNEAKVSTILWTGGPVVDMTTSLAGVLNAGVRFHEQGTVVPTAAQGQAAAAFQLGTFFAQIFDNDAGRLDADGATGGPEKLSAQPFHVGINDIQNLDPAGPFNRKVFNLFDAWAPNASHNHHSDDGCDLVDEESETPLSFASDYHGAQLAARAAIYRGQELFNNKEFDVSGVHGLNDVLGQTPVRATCSTCHNVPNVGGHAVFRMFDVGTADPSNCNEDLPMLTVKKNTGEERQLCDMGRGGSGAWVDLGSFRAPPLRGLAGRAPYFHDGQAKTIRKVIRYFNQRFNIGLTKHQKRDLEAFLSAL